MKIEPVTHMEVAEGVLAAIQKQVSKLKCHEWILSHYTNGREHGYHLHNWETRRAVSFAEYRNSDNIVVYAGEEKEFEFNTRIPDDNVYEGKMMFAPGDYKHAATYIVQFLKP